MICKPRDNISLEYLRSILKYDPETGAFTYIRSTSIRVRVGQVAGTLNKHNGRVYICVKYTYMQASILAWFYMTGEWPSAEVDHKDKNKSNNKWENLRLATHSQNNANKDLQSNNKSGYAGIFFSEKRQVWVAQIKINGKNKFLGHFKFKDNAIKQRDIAKKQLFGEFA